MKLQGEVRPGGASLKGEFGRPDVKMVSSYFRLRYFPGAISANLASASLKVIFPSYN
jgi:hypothetical protein